MRGCFVFYSNWKKKKRKNSGLEVCKGTSTLQVLLSSDQDLNRLMLFFSNVFTQQCCIQSLLMLMFYPF